jgi:hypothetical protein
MLFSLQRWLLWAGERLERQSQSEHRAGAPYRQLRRGLSLHVFQAGDSEDTVVHFFHRSLMLHL